MSESTPFSSREIQPQRGPVARVGCFVSLIRLLLNIGLAKVQTRSKVQTRYLCLTAAQREAIETQLEGTAMEYHFNASNQAAAYDFLMQHSLDQVSHSSLDSRWNVQWSSGWSIQDGEDYRTRTLYQWYLSIFCMCI